MITGSLFLMYVAGSLLGLAAGFVMHRSDYCVAGMFRDLFLFRKTFLLRALALQIVLTMIAFEAVRQAGLLPLYPFPLLGAPSLANIIGGFLFGIGMVLAGGCVVGTLYKMGAGSLLSASAFVGLIIGSGFYAEIHPWWAAVIKNTTFAAGRITVPELVGLDPVIFVVSVSAGALVLFRKWHREKKWETTSPVSGYLQPWKTAASLALIGLLSYLLVGMPMGITTTYAKIAAMIENLASPEHVASVGFYQALPLKIVHPFSGVLLKGGGGIEIDHIWVLQFPLIAGIILGSFASALLLGEFRLYWRVPPFQFVMTMGGGLILGMASRMVPGCNVWHLMGGLPIFAMQSILFLVGLLPGAWLGGKIIARLLVKKHASKGAAHD